MATGDRIPIITEKEYRIMSPPRRPRGEKPQTTIRFLQRQIANLQTRITTYYDDIQQKNKQIAAQDVKLSEAADREQIITTQAMSAAERVGKLLATNQKQAERLAYFEGYYHAKRETLTGSGPGYQGAHQDGETAGEEGRKETFTNRHGAAIGRKIFGIKEDNRAPDNGRSVARETDPDFREIGEPHAPGWTRR